MARAIAETGGVWPLGAAGVEIIQGAMVRTISRRQGLIA